MTASENFMFLNCPKNYIYKKLGFPKMQAQHKISFIIFAFRGWIFEIFLLKKRKTFKLRILLKTIYKTVSLKY